MAVRIGFPAVIMSASGPLLTAITRALAISGTVSDPAGQVDRVPAGRGAGSEGG
jgi:hypothetical protein